MHMFIKCYELMFYLLVAEQNNEILLKNHQSCPTGSTPFPEANGTSFDKHRGNYVYGRGRGCGRGHGRKINIERIVLIILQKGITHLTIRRIKMARVYKINHQTVMKISVIGVEWKVIGHVPIVLLNIW